MTIDLLAACHKRGPRFLVVVCVRERKNIPIYIYLRSKAFEYVERGEGKRVNVFFLTYREWHVALWLPYQYFFFNFNFLRHFLMCVLIFPPSGEETYHQYLWLGYDTIRAYHFTCLFFLSLSLVFNLP